MSSALLNQRRNITFEKARKGMFLIDEFNQRCRVEYISRKRRRIETRRYDAGVYWRGAPAEWSPEGFDGRNFLQLKSGPKWQR